MTEGSSIPRTSPTDFEAIREALLPLPTADDGYRKVLLLGTTGAGKTTVVRQLLGTDPSRERFPSTSTAKTTVADWEIVTTEAPTYRTAITFFPRDVVTNHLVENVLDAALAIFDKRPPRETRRRLLNHVNQRFRFEYVLGKPPEITEDDEATDSITGTGRLAPPWGLSEAEQLVTQKNLDDAEVWLGELIEGLRASIDDVLQQADKEGSEVVRERIEEQLDHRLDDDPKINSIVELLVNEIAKRFDTVREGRIVLDDDGWPVSWVWETDVREKFIEVVSRFTSNYAAWFGNLLTPLVNGIRVSGPFKPTWSTGIHKLVLVDGEGLGHTPNSSAAVGVHVVQSFAEVDHVLLVDNAQQPMQAASIAALRSLMVSGNSDKLVFLFTHFELVQGDNLVTREDRMDHVLASVRSVLDGVAKDTPTGARALERRLDSEQARFFVGFIHRKLDPLSRRDQLTMSQFDLLLAALARSSEQDRPRRTQAPVFSRQAVGEAVADAAKKFHSKWNGRLGLSISENEPKEHWARIKALSRRLAEGWSTEYDTLRPAAELLYQLQLEVRKVFENPIRWEHGEPDTSARDTFVDRASNEITQRIASLATTRLTRDVQPGWQEAYGVSGKGSATTRATLIANDVFGPGVPRPETRSLSNDNELVAQVLQILQDVADELGFILE